LSWKSILFLIKFKQIFESKSFEEFKKDNLFEFEANYVEFNFHELLRQSILFIPFIIFLFYFIESYIEMRSTLNDVKLMTE